MIDQGEIALVYLFLMASSFWPIFLALIYTILFRHKLKRKLLLFVSLVIMYYGVIGLTQAFSLPFYLLYDSVQPFFCEPDTVCSVNYDLLPSYGIVLAFVFGLVLCIFLTNKLVVKHWPWSSDVALSKEG